MPKILATTIKQTHSVAVLLLLYFYTKILLRVKIINKNHLEYVLPRCEEKKKKWNEKTKRRKNCVEFLIRCSFTVNVPIHELNVFT